MSKTAPNPQPTAQAAVYSFAEGSCYDNRDQLRGYFIPVVFRLFSVGRGLGQRVDVEFESNYGLYYQPDDDGLIAALRGAAPGLPWASLVYHRWHDQSRIQVVCPVRGTIVAQIETRRYHGRKVCAAKLAAGAYGANVVSLADARAKAVQLVVEVDRG